jgi:tetratricopeptide (TPR) repeat protein
LERYPEARDAYRQTTVLTPQNAPSWAYLGLCEYELHHYPKAFASLAKAEQLGLGEDRDLTGQVKYHLAILWNTAGHFDMGLKEIIWFARQNLGSPEIIEVIGLSLLRIPVFPEDLPENQREMVLLAGQASFAANTQSLELAQKYYDQLETTYPNRPNVHYVYGLFISYRDLDAALKEYEKEIEVNPSHSLARVQAAFLYLKLGQQEKALKDAQEAVQLDPHNPAAHNLAGRALMELNRTKEAIPELALATHLAPQSSSFHLNLARAYQKAGDKTLAAKEMATFNQLESKKAQTAGPQRRLQ